MKFSGNTDRSSARYWDDLAEVYQRETRISVEDFHFGPLLYGDSTLKLLPAVKGRRCLEIGCGAGQNSIVLAKRGAECIAIDISEEQLEFGRKLAAKENVSVDFRCVSMDALREDFKDEQPFDFIHSTYALPFSANPEKVIADAATMLNAGGIFLLTTGHPLYAGEWLEIGDDEDGLFISDCFNPEPDVRMSLDDKTMTAARYFPLSQISEWIFSAGLLIERLLEPPAAPMPGMTEKEILAAVPYDSSGWRELYPKLVRVPVVAIFKCRKDK